MKHLKQIFTSIFAVELLFSCAHVDTNKEMYISTSGVQTVFNVGEEFNHNGLVVLDSDSYKDINKYKLSIADGYIFQEADIGEVDVTISKSGYKSDFYTISVINNPRLIIETYPKQDYRVGERFTIEGMVVTDGENIITGFTSSIAEGTELNEVGIYEIIITKTGYFRAKYSISVELADALSVRTNPNKIYYQQGETFSSEGLVVEDQNHQLIDEYEISFKEGSIIKHYGDIEVKVSKPGYTPTSFTIRVTYNSGQLPSNKNVNVYYVNDTHGSFIRQELEGTTNEGGMANIGQYILDNTEHDQENDIETIVLSGGDMFQGGLESNSTRGAIMADAMNIIGFDAMVLGNHELDWGEDILQTAIDKLDCPVISANTFHIDSGSQPDYVQPFVVLDKGDLRIGIIGGAEVDMGRHVTASYVSNLTFPDPKSYIQTYSTELRLSYNCDLVLVAFHDEGYDRSSESEPVKFNSLTKIDPLTNSKYVDAMFFAHDHYTKKGVYNGVPFIESGCNGRYVGIMSLSLSPNGYSYIVDDSEIVNRNAYNYCQNTNAEIDALPAKYAEQIGDPDEVIYTFKKSYSSDAFTLVMCHAMYWYVNEHIEDFGGKRIYLASHNLGGIRANVRAGEFTRRDLFKVNPFENELCVQICDRTQINRTISYDYYATYTDDEIVYSSGYTRAVSISYISEASNAGRYQSGYIKYPYIARDALVEFLLANVDDTL